MRRGFSLAELTVVVLIVGVCVAIALPRWAGLRDWIAADRATRDVTTALAVARHTAVMASARARLTIAPDTLRIDLLQDGAWEPWWRRPGPADHGVRLEVSNPVVTFGPTGIGWGAANTKIVLRRGSQVETVTTSRLGRVLRW